jgi:penicillin amidase
LLRRIRIALIVLASLIVALLLAAWLVLRASLPDLDGSVAAGVDAPTSLDRDDLGAVTVRGRSRADVAWALGYAHGQDRFFQMDLSRRLAAGELAELVGAAAVSKDREMRLYRFRHTAQEVLKRATPHEREVLEQYAAGVNAGLDSLGSRPFEYWLLRNRPAPWRAEDCALVVFAMWIDLTYSEFADEAARGAVRDTLPEPLYRFIYSRGSDWDAPVVGAALPLPPVPGADVYDMRKLPAAQSASTARRDYEHVETGGIGSNSWAVGGAHTATGAGLVANDMHLGLRVPNTWYHARMQIQGEDGRTNTDLTGVTLPGVPSLVVGSNGTVAWGYTNSYGDWVDLIELDVDPAAPDSYATAEGPRAFETINETIHVHDAPDESLQIRETIWGPVFDTDLSGRPRAAAWTAQDPVATNMAGLGLESAGTVSEALDIAARSGIPPQNFVVVDAAGNLGWTIMGQIPIRSGYDPRAPANWSSPGVGWQGWLAPEAHPRLFNPPQGRVWTANARVVDGAALASIGEGNFALGARAGEIRDSLLALDKAREQDMLAIQLDDRTRVHERWQPHLLALLDATATTDNPARSQARRLVADWHGHASADSAGFRILRAWRDRIRDRVFASLLQPVKARKADLDLPIPSLFEGPLWELVRTEPAHLLDPKFASWREFELAMLDEVLQELGKECARLDDCTWGKRNTVRIRHPLSGAVPMLAPLLDMRAVELPGDIYAPRVQGPAFGASERLAVSPGHEAQGYFHMPGGQSGHPLSNFYRAGFDAWVEGRPLPFLPGEPAHHLAFMAARP